MSQQIIPTTGWNNCGGRCRLLLHMNDGKIEKITGDPDYPDLMPCVKGLHYHETFLGEDRLRYPMKRVGKRGEGKFERITWDEALDTIAAEWVRIRDTYGAASRYVQYGWGVSAGITGLAAIRRLLRLDGGHLGYYNSYSTGCCAYTTPYLYGTTESGSSYDTLMDSGLIILWAHNPEETKFDNLMYYLRQAKKKGTPIVVIDPRKNATVETLGAQWISLRPGTDAALMDAMAYVIYTEDLYDHRFVENYCQGFTRETMPAGADVTDCYFDYLAGTKDGIEKTPKWAEAITGVPEAQIVELARRYATTRPAALIQGYGGQRHTNGEQFTRGGIMLACLTGNTGVSGGWAAGIGHCHMVKKPAFPTGDNPVKAEIPVYAWTEAMETPETMTAEHGLKGADHLSVGIKMLFNLAGNVLMNQHGDLNRTRAILEDETKCEFIVCSDLFLTPTAKYADILLPGVSIFEMDNITAPWSQGNFLSFSRKIMEPVGESRPELDWIGELAGRLGLQEEFSAGHETCEDWLKDLYEQTRKLHPQLPDYAVFKELGIYRFSEMHHRIPFADHVFQTPSGKVEIYSPVLKEMNHDRIPPIPGYVPAKEGPGARVEYPLQLLGYHTKGRCHSVHDNNLVLREKYPQQLWMNPEDGFKRGITDADIVSVFNDRGRVELPVYFTDGIMEGCVAIAQGSWYEPDEQGIDHRGSINVLTSLERSPLSNGNGQHTNLVEVIPKILQKNSTFFEESDI